MRKHQSLCNMSPATLPIDSHQLLPFFSGFFFSLGAGLWALAAAGAGDAEGAEGWGGGDETHSVTAAASPAGMGTQTAGQKRVRFNLGSLCDGFELEKVEYCYKLLNSRCLMFDGRQHCASSSLKTPACWGSSVTRISNNCKYMLCQELRPFVFRAKSILTLHSPSSIINKQTYLVSLKSRYIVASLVSKTWQSQQLLTTAN